MPTPALTSELRKLADRAADRALAALHAAVAHRGEVRRTPVSALEGRLARHVDALPATVQARLRGLRTRTVEPIKQVARAEFRWPAPLIRGAAPQTHRAFDLRLLSLRCDDDTREAGDDDMAIGLVRVVLDHGDPVTQATDVQGPFTLGGFRKGDARTFSPAKTLTTVTGSAGPRTVTTVLLLADIDYGGLGGLLAAMAGGVTDELLLELAQSLLVTSGAIFGATFFGTLGSIFGPVGTAGGIVVGVALGAAVGYAVGKALEGLVQLFKDDPLDPVDWTVGIPTDAAAGLLEARQIAFTGRHAAYSAAFEWRAR